MGNKLSGSPLPGFDVAASSYSTAEMQDLRVKFSAMWLAKFFPFQLLLFNFGSSSTIFKQQPPGNYNTCTFCKGIFFNLLELVIPAYSSLY